MPPWAKPGQSQVASADVNKARASVRIASSPRPSAPQVHSPHLPNLGLSRPCELSACLSLDARKFKGYSLGVLAPRWRAPHTSRMKALADHKVSLPSLNSLTPRNFHVGNPGRLGIVHRSTIPFRFIRLHVTHFRATTVRRCMAMVFVVFSSGASSSKRYKAACDQCHKSKLKCPGGGAPCKRCSDGGHHCHYSLTARIGKPPGTKNRKTLERLRQANATGVRDELQPAEADASIQRAYVNEQDVLPKQPDVGENSGDCANIDGAFRIPRPQDFDSLSPPEDYLGLPSTPQSSNTSPGYLLEFDSSTHFQDRTDPVMNVRDTEVSQFPTISEDELQIQWSDLSPDIWSVRVLSGDLLSIAEEGEQ